jgi:heme/copper-type cytochrome/quinol oxidase subunit 3
MQSRTGVPLRVISDPRPQPAIPSAVLGMSIFVASEAMLFAGLISAFSIARAGSLLGWPPPGQPRLPADETAINTLALLASAAVLWWAGRLHRREQRSAARPMLGALALAAFFVCFQGWEWTQLLAQGLTMLSSQHGAFFYLIIGIHGLHCVAAILALIWAYRRLATGVLAASTFQAVRVFWYFVVGLWPLIYWRVYF